MGLFKKEEDFDELILTDATKDEAFNNFFEKVLKYYNKKPNKELGKIIADYISALGGEDE